jgi:hypothetical protein
MTRERTGAERVFAVLRRAGSKGTNRLQWAGPDVIDGGAPILHLAGRIAELRDAGVRIATHTGPGRLAQYVLEVDELVEELVDELQIAPDTLIDPPTSPTSGAFDPFSDWA